MHMFSEIIVWFKFLYILYSIYIYKKKKNICLNLLEEEVIESSLSSMECLSKYVEINLVNKGVRQSLGGASYRGGVPSLQ